MHPNNTSQNNAGKNKTPVLTRIFISPDEHRMRAGWRISFQTLLWQLLTTIVFLGFVLLGQEILYNRFLLNKSISLISVIVSIYLARKYLDHRSFVSLGLRINTRALWDILSGITIAGAMMLLIFFIEWTAGWLQFEGFAWQRDYSNSVLVDTLEMLLLFCIVAFDEELLSRGYHLQNLEDGTNLLWGMILSSVLFAFMHSYNPNYSIAAWVGLFSAGMFLGLAYVLTRQLWLPIGLHIGWNFFEGTIFGFRVSGLESFRIIEQNVQGPPIITGGAFGPEAGLILIPALGLGTLLIYLYSRSRRSKDIGMGST